MPVIAVANQKGGVAKSTTAANLAWSLAEDHGARVCLVDFDPQGSLTEMLLADPPAATMADLLGGTPWQQVAREVRPGLALLPASEELAELALALGRESEGALALRRALQPLQRAFDFTLVDTPPSLGTLTVNALCAANAVLVPVACSTIAVAGLAQLLDTVEAARGGAPEPTLLGILPVLFDARTLHHREVAEGLRREFGDAVLPQPIPRTVRFEDANVVHQPLVAMSPAHPGAEAYRAAAAQLVQRSRTRRRA